MVTLAGAQEALAKLDQPVRADMVKALTGIMDHVNRTLTMPAHVFLHRVGVDGDTVHVARGDLSDSGGPLYFDEKFWRGQLAGHWFTQDSKRFADHRVTGFYTGKLWAPLNEYDVRREWGAPEPSDQIVVELQHVSRVWFSNVRLS